MLGGLLVIGLFVGLLYRAATAALHADRFERCWPPASCAGWVPRLREPGYESGAAAGHRGTPAAGVVRGSSVIAAWIGVGLVLKVSRR